MRALEARTRIPGHAGRTGGTMSDFDFGVILWAQCPSCGTGMQLTLQLTALADGGRIVLGTCSPWLRLSPSPLAWLVAGYVNFLRSIPLILVVFWFYILVPMLIGRPVGGFPSALIAFTMFEAAYYCEIMRAGIPGVRAARSRPRRRWASPTSRRCAMSCCRRPCATWSRSC